MLAVLALGGCGDGTDSGGDSGDGADGATLAEWSNRAEELCEQNANRAERAVLRLAREARAEDISRREYAARVLDESARQAAPTLERLAAIPPPRGHEQEVDEFITRLQKALESFVQSADALRSRDAQAVGAANRAILEQAVPARELARELNIESCIPSGSR